MSQSMASNNQSEASSSRSNNGDGDSTSVVVDVGRRKSTCGYCKSGSKTSISHGLWAHSLTVDDYQALLDRGWRRSGCFLYKPEMERTCCPSYTIRLKARDFVPSKEQIRVYKRMQRFLDGSLNVKKSDDCSEPSTSRDSNNLSRNEPSSVAPMDCVIEVEEQKNKLQQLMQCLSDQIDNALRACIEREEISSDILLPKVSVKKVAPTKRKLLGEGSEDLLYSSNISFQVAAALRRVNKNADHLKSSVNNTKDSGHPSEPTPQEIAEKLSRHLTCATETFDLSVKACNGHINFYSNNKQPCVDLTIDKVANVSNGCCLKKSSGCPSRKSQSLEIRLKRSDFDPEEYALYRRYQIKVHNDNPDQVTESSYRRFLVDSPLCFVPSTGDGFTPFCGFGSFHQQYLINGQLVAVGVIDILPRCLSSKYLFWDPEFAFLSLGKYSALQEISWVRENEVHCPSLQYYYLGYYIHSCKKMRYKAAYRPSELLCPLRYQWVPFDNVKQLLDKKAYTVLSDFPALQNEEPPAANLIENMEHHDDPSQEESNDIPIYEDEEMSELDSEGSDDELDPESTSLLSTEIENETIGDVMIGLKGLLLRYKDIRQAFGDTERNYLENQLHRYVKAVGVDLSERMVYSLG